MARKKKFVCPKKVIKAYGSRGKAAEALDVTQQCVGQWVLRKASVPATYHIRLAHDHPEEFGHLLNA